MATSFDTSHICDYDSLYEFLRKNKIFTRWYNFNFAITDYTHRVILSELAQWMFVKDGFHHEFIVNHGHGSFEQTFLCESNYTDEGLIINCKKKVNKKFSPGQKIQMLLDKEKIEIEFENFPFAPDKELILDQLGSELISDCDEEIMKRFVDGIIFYHGEDNALSHADIDNSKLFIEFICDNNHPICSQCHSYSYCSCNRNQ